MARESSRRPTEAELSILDVLWCGGPTTVREVFRQLEETRGYGYTTVLKLMQIMTEKELVVRDASVRPQVYRAARTRKQVQKQLTGDLLERLFSGSPSQLVMHALSTKKTTADERREIRELLDRLEEDRR